MKASHMLMCNYDFEVFSASLELALNDFVCEEFFESFFFHHKFKKDFML